jgi:Kef-type K+ transport system membrane component KefB
MPVRLGRARGLGDHALVRLRTLTFGFLTPFYFIRAGAFVSIPALIAAPLGFVLLLLMKMVTKFTGVYPVTKTYNTPQWEVMYTTLLLPTGLTFGTISPLFGLSHHIIDQSQSSILVAGVIGSAVVPTLIANTFYLPWHLLPQPAGDDEALAIAEFEEQPSEPERKPRPTRFRETVELEPELPEGPTTFSSFSLQTLSLLQDGARARKPASALRGDRAQGPRARYGRGHRAARPYGLSRLHTTRILRLSQDLDPLRRGRSLRVRLEHHPISE